MRRIHRPELCGLVLLLAAACEPTFEGRSVLDHPDAVKLPLEARCTANVVGTGVVDVETDYLPHVVACENGNADFEALRAQAVAARSYLYYRLATGDGSITDGQGDQVYTCNRAPSQEHYDAVSSTAGEVLMYRDTLVAAFYVAGAVPSDRLTCLAAPGDNDYSNTERYVTLNWEASGDGVEQTSLGWVNPANYANRGCHSQNGAHCLAEAGWTYEDILHFYYGADIERVVATGECAQPTGLPHGCGVVVEADADVTVYDDGDLCFLKGCAAGPAWRTHGEGVGGSSLVTAGLATGEDDCFGRWRLSFEKAGTYAIDVHIPDVAPRVSEAAYRVRHAGVDDEVVVRLSEASGWVELGAFEFDVGSFQYVELGDRAPESGTLDEGPFVVFDAVRVRRPEGPMADAGPPADDDAGSADSRDAGTPADDKDAGEAPSPEYPPSVVECACVAARERAPAGLLGVALLFGLLSRAARGAESRSGRLGG